MKSMFLSKISAQYLFLLLICLLFSCKKGVEETHSKSSNELFCDAEFNTFFKKFTTDSLYQASHVQFPLEINYFEKTEGDSVYEVSEQVFENNFLRMLRLPETESAIGESKFNKHITTLKDTVNCEYTSEGETRNMVYQFIYKDNCWYLRAISDDSLYQPDPFRSSKLREYTQ